jgi:hypothetical protein
VKHAFAAGAIDCLLINKSMSVGIDFQSPRESVCILVEPVVDPGDEDQFIGRVVRNDSHALCPDDFKKASYVSFVNTVPKSKTDEEPTSQEEETSRHKPRYINDSVELNSERIVNSATSYIESELLVSSLPVYRNHAYLSPWDLIKDVERYGPRDPYCYKCDGDGCGGCEDSGSERYTLHYEKRALQYDGKGGMEDKHVDQYVVSRKKMDEYDLALATITIDHALHLRGDMNCTIQRGNGALKSNLSYYKRLNQPKQEYELNQVWDGEKDVLQLIYNKL